MGRGEPIIWPILRYYLYILLKI